MATREVFTEADLLQAPRDGRKHELVDGRIVVSPAGYRHGRIAVRLVIRLGQYAKDHQLGDVLDSSTGFRLPGGNVRSPDVAFVAAARVPNRAPEGFFDGAPDLAVEILRRRRLSPVRRSRQRQHQRLVLEKPFTIEVLRRSIPTRP
jgi:Uma2 family endonuclease